MYASVVKKEHMLKLKIFAPQMPFSIHSSHGMETSIVKKYSLLKLSINSVTSRENDLLPSNQDFVLVCCMGNKEVFSIECCVYARD